MAVIEALPDEIVHHILHYVPPRSTLCTVTRLSQRFNRVAHDPQLWRHYCQTEFKYWQAEHHIKEKFHSLVGDVDWEQLFVLRLRRNQRTASLLDEIVTTRLRRLANSEEICGYGYDAKDYLMTQCRVDDACQDVLARRYYAGEVLDSIHRSLAIEEWAKYPRYASRLEPEPSLYEQFNRGMRLERALGAFDMFVLHDNEGDLDETSEILDDLSLQFQSSHSDLETLSTRQKAVALASWLHTQNLIGMDEPGKKYRYFRNCLIGRALRDDSHPSLPIISVAIYCCIASRLGLEAYCCALPQHVHAIILSPLDTSLDGRPLEGPQGQREKMFLDPYGSSEEVPLTFIQNFLMRFGAHNGQERLMSPTFTDVIVMRTAQNIRASFTSYRTLDRPPSDLIPMIELNRGDWARNLKPALYSTIWASIMMVPILPDDENDRHDWQQDAGDLLAYYHEYFPQDAWLIEKYVCPMYDTFATPAQREIRQGLPSRRAREQIRENRRLDASQRPPRLRSQLSGDRRPKFKIGQVFRHKRYDWYGLILAWAVDGAGASSMAWEGTAHWTETRYSQPFYRCLVGTDGSDNHLIAEDNVELCEFHGDAESLPREVKDLMHMAGKFFKRWDGERGVFVSNLKELYPED